ncbi:MAG: replicative DNA helicase [Lachnospiraceae bacterium]|nr:replicative DNA helicase [Lachnospiraceae bacterium]
MEETRPNDNDILQRTSPQNLEAEKSVIASMLMDKEAIETALGMLTKEDFYSRQYGMMFEAIRKLYFNLDKDAVPDLVTVQEQLAKDGAPAEMQSTDYLRALFEASPISVNIRSYAEIVRNKSIQRRLIKTCGEISQMCYDDNEKTEDILAETEGRVFDILKNGTSAEFVPIEEIVINVYNKIQEATLSKDHITGLTSGFIDLDNMTTGFQPSDFILIAARPSMGKTAFVLNILEHVAIKKNRPCMVFSLEMSKEQLVNRLFAMDSGIDAQDLRSGKIGESDQERLLDTADRIGSSNIVIDDTPAITVTELRSKCRKVKLERGLDLVIIDYLQLMSGGGTRHSDSRQQEVSDISRALKALARDIECPVIALSQLSRAVETRTDKRPMLSDLRESGAIEQDADLVMFLYRDEYYHPDSEHKGEAEVIIAKQRNGPIGTVRLYWQSSITKFVSIEKNYT